MPILPPGASASHFASALAGFEAAVGKARVFSSDVAKTLHAG